MKSVRLGKFIEEHCEKNKKGEDIPVFSVTNTNGFCTEYFSKDVSSKDKSNYKIVHKGFFAYNPSRINVGSVDWLRNEEKVIVSPLYNVFSVSPELEKQYLYYFLKSERGKTLIKSKAEGSVRDNLKFSILADFPIPLPSIEEQQKFVAKLDKASELILKYKRLLEYYDSLIKSRFIEMFGDPVQNPMGWEVKPMGELLSLLTDFSSNGSYKTLDSNVIMYDEPNYALMIRTTDLESGDFSNNVKWVDEKAYNLLSKSKVFGKEIIMNKIGSAGKVYLMPELNRPVTLGRNAFLFRYKENINSVYIYFLLTSEYGQNEIKPYIRGAVTKTITKDDARKIRIPVPPITLQNNFENFVQQIDKSKFEIEKIVKMVYN